MRLTKHGHACVRVEQGSSAVVIDPGEFSGADLLRGAHAVLVTHEHFDHVDVPAVTAALRENPDLTVWTNDSVAARFTDVPRERIRVVRHGDTFDAAGMAVHVYGEKHAPTHLAPVRNIGFLIGGEVFHPGDAFTVPEEPVRTLLLPTNAPWLKATEVVDYASRVTPERAYSIHDGLVNEIGTRVIGNILNAAAHSAGGDYQRIPPGEAVELY
ncbi:L-ascorbate metabolism protein UlaG (beta-lactamase superfamily) [Lipingzhangella halophila]|uniref:L-ascorbate metabolism protein UlaG (Beta-lactamase superfamily) n=1 Tax=Lipingzhangella halophila TaxID=1783352 RepID=A0A7W7RM46_9ACTN|nr:MBL fold metallo-hydrolase [Lipingzhangella halophila]MBB4934494.1 L-ascorbate metabolism protein UlaG (beta-lactamase superfamily) [Lipingzhangella halophila]